MTIRRIPSKRMPPGPWVPLDIAPPLFLTLKQLRLWAKCHQPMDPAIARVINLHLADLGHLIDLQEEDGVVVSADRWHETAGDLRQLVELLATSG